MPVTLMRFPPNIRSTCELPAGFKVEPLGSRAEVVAMIGEVFPEGDYSDPACITVRTQDTQTELAIHGDPVEAIALQRPARNVIVALCNRIGCRAIDTATGDLMNFD
jgi:hypothetical protein